MNQELRVHGEAEKIRQNMEPTHKLGDEQLKMLTTTSDSHLKQRYSKKKINEETSAVSQRSE